MTAALDHFALRGQYPVHRADRTQLGAFIQQARKDLRGRLIGEAGTAQMVQDPGPLTLRQGAVRRRARLCGPRGGAASAARCRKTLARDTGSAAQTADVKPPPAGKAIAAAIMMFRRARMSVPSPPAAPPLFFGWR